MKLYYLLLVLLLLACSSRDARDVIPPQDTRVPSLDLAEANRLADLPLKCIQTPLPYKAGHVLADSSDLAMPRGHHPAFYGCFDWHSAVHGHWSLVYLLKNFPDMARANEARQMLSENLTVENIQKEIKYFSMNKYTASFERTYGWAWLLVLSEELYSWDDSLGQQLYRNLKPLAQYISDAYVEYLPKLVYPIRVGEHSNTAFGLSFAYEYAESVGDTSLSNAIRNAAIRFYTDDSDCPIGWEPSGYDFLSPCLQELDIMRKILAQDEFYTWSSEFLPELREGSLALEPGKVIDRSDGKLVHLDGLNFSRAWVLYPLNPDKFANARPLADEHMNYSLGKIRDGDYSGEHWLASFALYAYKQMEGE